jgi:outer membrane protein assembly factor BamB
MERPMIRPALRSIVLGVFAAAAAPVSAGDAATPDWPQWRGPTRDGQCPGPRWPGSLQPAHLARQWRVGDLGPSYAGPIVTGDRVFSFETRDEREEIVRAFDRATGQELWKAAWTGSMKVPFFAARNGSWVRSTPAFDGERLYAGGMQDVLVCLDARTGEVAWRVDFKETVGTPEPAFGLVCSPLVTDEHVFVQAGGSLAKLDKRTGEIVWRALEDGGGMNSVFSSPVILELADRPQLVAQTRTELCGVDPEGGAVLWRQPVKAFRGMNILTPMPHGSAILTAPYGGRAQLLDVRPGDDGLEVTRRWHNRLQGYMTSPVIVDGHAYLFTRSNRFACIDLATGEPSWISGPTGDSYWSLVARDDRILALADTGTLRLIRATPEAYEVLDEVSVADEPTWAHLAVAGDELFIREQHGLAAFTWR